MAAAFAAAATIARVNVVNQRLTHATMEPRGATARYDAATGHYALRVCSQSAGVMRDNIAAVMNIPKDTLRVITEDVGGAFGMKTGAFPEYIALMVGESLPRGGELTIGSELRGGLIEIVVRGEGPKLTFAPELRASFARGGGDEGVTTRTATSYLIQTLVAQAGGQLALSGPEEPFLMFGVSLPI